MFVFQDIFSFQVIVVELPAARGFPYGAPVVMMDPEDIRVDKPAQYGLDWRETKARQLSTQGED